MKARVRNYSISSLLSLILILIIISCSKKPDTIGLNLVDANKPTVGFDTTINIFAYSTLDDSVISDETSVNLLGSYYSETFGRSNASIYTHLRLSALAHDWGANPVADSVVLKMVYSGAYGNLNTLQTVRVYRVLEDFTDTASYSSNTYLHTATAELGVHSFYPDTSKITVIDSLGGEPDTSLIRAELRIPLYNSFADLMFILDTNNTGSSQDFIDYFKGIQIKPDDVNAPGDGAILYFDLLDGRSELTIHYKNDTADSLKFDYLINLNSARVGRYKHEYELSTDPDFINMILNGDTTLGTEKLYLQAMGGVKTNLRFPGLQSWLDSTNRIINEAKLIINLTDDNTEYPPSTSLILFKYKEDGGFDFLPDQVQGDNYFDGDYDEETNSYQFRISLHAQDLILGEPDHGLGLFTNAKSIRGTEMILHGTDSNNPERIQLRITYSDAN